MLVREPKMRPLAARCHASLGSLYRRAGQREAPLEDLSTAVAMLRDMGMPRWLEEAEAELKALT